MIKPDLNIPGEMLARHVTEAVDFWMGQPGVPLTRDIQRAVSGEDIHAAFVPAVKVVVDSTLAIVEEPEIQELLPDEINARAHAAVRIAETLGREVALRGVISGMHASTPRLAGLPLGLLDVEALKDSYYIPSIGGAPFSDVRVIAGGSFRFLKDRDFDTPSAREIITNSRELLAISGVYKLYMPQLLPKLGIPYVVSEYLTLRTGENGPTVGFSDQAKQWINDLQVPGHGCPAGRLGFESEHGRTLLEAYWARITEFLIPDSATANDRTQKKLSL